MRSSANRTFLCNLVVACAMAVATSAAAETHRVLVACEDGSKHVEAWDIAGVDQTYIRIQVAAHHPNCSVHDYDAERDADLRVEEHKDADAVVGQVPLIGQAYEGIKGLFRH